MNMDTKSVGKLGKSGSESLIMKGWKPTLPWFFWALNMFFPPGEGL